MSEDTKSLSEIALEAGNERLAKHIAKGEEAAKRFAERQQARKEGKTIPSAPRKVKEKPQGVLTIPMVQFGEDDVLDDRDFIIKTRDSNIHSDQMRRYFFANGGKRYVEMGLDYAAAYGNLRGDKMRALRK